MSNQNLNQLNGAGSYFVQVSATVKLGIFPSNCDYEYFLSLLKKYLTDNEDVGLLAYCLAKNHFDLLMSQNSSNGISFLMHELLLDYNKYYFEKYNVDDITSESNYIVKFVERCELLETSKKIHKKLKKWRECPYSSIRAYLYNDTPEWLNRDKIADVYGSAIKYLEYLRKDTTV